MKTLLLLFLLLLGLTACALELYFLFAFIRSRFGKYPPFVVSFGCARKMVLAEAENFLEKARKNIKVYDLGCGSGALLLPLARKFPHHSFIGYEWDWVPLLIAKFRCRNQKNIKIIKADFMKQNYKDAGLILCYTGNLLKKTLGNKLNNELKKGTLVISEAFELDYLPPKGQISTPTLKIPIKVFLYQK